MAEIKLVLECDFGHIIELEDHAQTWLVLYLESKHDSIIETVHSNERVNDFYLYPSA